MEETRGAIQQTHFINLSQEESTNIVEKVKTIVGPDSNITHLGHAAMVLALLSTSPDQEHAREESIDWCSPCWLNGRRYLMLPTNSFFPNCVSFAPLEFPITSDLRISATISAAELRDKVVKVCKIATAEYKKIRERKSMLPENVARMEKAGASAWRKKQEQSPSLITGAQPSNVEPFFLSDGRAEQYVLHSYPMNSAPVIEVDDLCFAGNAEKNLIVRMSSWRSRTTISGEWISCDFDDGDIITFLEKVVTIMKSIIA